MEGEKFLGRRSSKDIHALKSAENFPNNNNPQRYDNIFNSFLQHQSLTSNLNNEVEGSFVFSKRSKWADVRVVDSYVGADENPLIKESLGNDQFVMQRCGKLETVERLLRERKAQKMEGSGTNPVMNNSPTTNNQQEKTTVNKRYLPMLLSSSFVRDDNNFLNSMVSPRSCKNFTILMNEATAAEKEKFLHESISVDSNMPRELISQQSEPNSTDIKTHSSFKHHSRREIFDLENPLESKLISNLKERFNIYKQNPPLKPQIAPRLPEKIETPNGPLQALQKLFEKDSTNERHEIFSGVKDTSISLNFASNLDQRAETLR